MQACLCARLQPVLSSQLMYATFDIPFKEQVDKRRMHGKRKQCRGELHLPQVVLHFVSPSARTMGHGKTAGPQSGNLLSTTKEVGSQLQSRFHRLHYMPCKLVTTHYSSEAIRWCQLAMTSSSLRIQQGGNDATNSAEKSPHLPQVLQEPHTGYPRTTRPCDQAYQTANNMFRACKRIK